MGNKLLITNYKNRCMSALFCENECRRLHFDEAGLTGRIYVGRVENVVKNLNCAFVEIEKGVKCYYSLADNQEHIFLNRKNNTAVNVGDLLLVQVEREAAKTKPATAVCKISFSGEYVALASDGSSIHVSEKIKSNEYAKELKAQLYECLSEQTKEYPFSLILRTNSIQAEKAQVLSEAERIVKKYVSIRRAAEYSKALTLLYKPQPFYLEDIKNLRLTELEAVITDDKSVYENILENAGDAVKSVLRLYEDDLLPLYKLYSIETQLERALGKKVWLKSGGYLIIEQTEALTVVDVNSGKMIKKNDSYLKTNLEAATELVRQLELRNISGIIIIDFINMKSKSEREQLILALRKEISKDTEKTSYIDMTKLGLVELTRRKNGKSLSEIWRNKDEQ